MQRRRPSREILTGESADVYFARADEILAAEGLDPLVTMEVFSRRSGLLCGVRAGLALLIRQVAAPREAVKRDGREEWLASDRLAL